MPRRKRTRYVQLPPAVNAFHPVHPPPWGEDEITLSVEGLEAIRLCDLEGLDQQAAAERMKISRPTLGRVLAEARAIVAEALVMGKKLKIEGGDFETPGRAGWHQGRHRRGGGR